MSKKTTSKVVSFAKKTLPVFVGGFAAVSAVALTVRYYGDRPVISDVAKGLKGDVVGLFQ
jgi:hypothetical protein